MLGAIRRPILGINATTIWYALRDEAPSHAAKRHDALLEAGDVDECAVCERIIRAIDELLAK